MGLWFRLTVIVVAASGVSACGGSSTAAPNPPVQGPGPAPQPVPGNDYTAFTAETAVTLIGYTGDAMEPFVTKDGRFLIFNNSNGAPDTDLYYALRIDALTFQFQGPLTGANSPQLDGVASVDEGGRMIFVSTRSYDATLSTLYVAPFENGSVGPPAVLAGVSLQQPGMVNFDAEVSGDGKTLYFDDGKYSAGGTLQAATLVVADRQGDGFARRADSATMLAAVNAAGLNYAPAVSTDGLELFFTRADPAVAGGQPAIYRAARTATTQPFSTVQRVVAATGFVEGPTLSADGHLLYYHRRTDAGFRLYRVQR